MMTTGLQIQLVLHARAAQELRVFTNLLQPLRDIVKGGLQLF